MKELILIRHAYAEWAHSSQTDFERPLSERGQAEAHSAGMRLAETGMMPDLILSSPAVRALETARIIAHQVGYEESKISLQPNIYEGHAEDWIQIIRRIHDEHDTVVLIGHNPTITDVLNILSDTEVRGIPTCGTVHTRCEIQAWKEIGPGKAILISADRPPPG